MKPRKHRIYSYSGAWYYTCGRCVDSRSSGTWWQVRDLLHLHIDARHTVDTAGWPGAH